VDDNSRRDLTAPWRHIDPILLFCTLAVGALGTLMVFSATKGSDAVADTTFVKKQGLFMLIGVVLMLVVSLIDYRRVQDFAYVLYGGACFLLFLVVSPLGKESKGAQAWFQFGPFQFEPSEISKICLIVGLAALLAQWRGDIDLKRLGYALLFAGLPMGLIMLQPRRHRDGGRGAPLERAEGVPEGPPHDVPRPRKGQVGHRLQPQPVDHHDLARQAHGRRPVPGQADPVALRPRAADRLHLHRRR
jgi:hypothetical protein